MLAGCHGGRPAELVTIAGIVTEVNTGKPVWNAAVQVVGTQKGAMTGQDGRFRIVRMAQDTYVLRVSHINYETVDVVDIQAGRNGAYVEIEMAVKVTDLHNDPVVLPEVQRPRK